MLKLPAVFASSVKGFRDDGDVSTRFSLLHSSELSDEALRAAETESCSTLGWRRASAVAHQGARPWPGARPSQLNLRTHP